MDIEIEKLIDSVWNSSLTRITKKELPATRPSLGDDIDLFVPQERALLLLENNPALASLIYNASYLSANRNAYIIMRKLNMPADYFWKFEFWPHERAFDTLQRVINRVFSAMMHQHGEGILTLKDVDADKMRFIIQFDDCVECAGISATRPICYYHAAVFSGIIAALMNKDMEGFETECRTQGHDACIFLIGKKDDPEISTGTSDYLTATKLEIGMQDRLKECLSGAPLRGIGNLVNIAYSQLLNANSLVTNPKLLSSPSFDVGVERGTKLASMIADFYKDNKLDVIKKYFNQLRHLEIEFVETEPDIVILVTECAEISAELQNIELLGFLQGELQGLISSLLNKKIVIKESHVEDGKLRMILSPEV